MAVVATGFFDGVHLGHREVITTLVSSARKKGEEALVVTFDAHPRTVLQQDAGRLRLLTTPQERERLLLSLGVDRVETIPFSKQFASMEAESYIRNVLMDKFKATSIILGYDNRLGSDMLGVKEIGNLCAGLGLKMEEVAPYVMPDGTTVSSTRIRNSLAGGMVDYANDMLGYKYMLTGVVVSGKQIGRTIGFPTANTLPSAPLKLVPERGVYLTEVDVLGGHFYGMTNIGDVVETNIFDFDESIYGLELTLRFISRIRDMRTMSGLDDLKSQLSADKLSALQMLNALN